MHAHTVNGGERAGIGARTGRWTWWLSDERCVQQEVDGGRRGAITEAGACPGGGQQICQESSGLTYRGNHLEASVLLGKELCYVAALSRDLGVHVKERTHGCDEVLSFDAETADCAYLSLTRSSGQRK